MKNVLVCFEDSPIGPVSYLRLISHIHLAPPSYKFKVFQVSKNFDEINQELANCSILFMVRNTSLQALKIAKTAKKINIPIVFDIDDYLWKLPEYLGGDSSKAEILDSIISISTIITSPQPELLNFLKTKFPNINQKIVPNTANVNINVNYTHVVKAIIANSDFFRIPNFKKDFFRSIHDAAKSCNKKIILYYFSNDPPEFFTDTHYLSIIWLGIRSFSSWRELLTILNPQIAFVPLSEDGFSKYKSVVKFAEYGSVGCVGIFSDVAPYNSFIKSGFDGWLAENSYSAWYNQTKAVLRLSTDELETICQNSKTRAIQEFDRNKTTNIFYAVLGSLEAKDFETEKAYQSNVLLDRPFELSESYHHILDQNKKLKDDLDFYQNNLYNLFYLIKKLVRLALKKALLKLRTKS